MRNPIPHMKLPPSIALPALLSLFASTPSFFAQSTWTGGGADQNFSTAQNWSGSVAPVAGTTTIYTFTGSSNLSPTINTGATYQVSSIVFDASAGSFNVRPLTAGILTQDRFQFAGSSRSIVQSSANNQTVSATLLLTDATSSNSLVNISGTGTGSLTLDSLRLNGGTQTLNFQRDATIGNITAAGGGGSVVISSVNPDPASTISLSGSNYNLVSLFSFASGGGNTISATGAGGFTSTAAIAATQALSFSGNQPITISGSFTYNGSVDKTLTFGNSGGTVLGASGGSMQLGAANGTGSRTITFATTTNSTGTILSNISGSASTGTTSILKTGQGTLVLAGSNSYSGTTTVSAGTLLLSGSASLGSGSVAVTGGSLGVVGGANAQIGGATSIGNGGSLGVLDSAFGTLSFSASSGVALDLANAVSGSNNGTLRFDLGAPGSSDKFVLSSTGALNIGSSLLEFSDFSFGTLSGFGPGSYVLFDTNTTIQGTLGSVTSGLIGGYTGSIGFANGGQDLVLTVVPEPGTATLLGIGLFAALGCARRRSRK